MAALIQNSFFYKSPWKVLAAEKVKSSILSVAYNLTWSWEYKHIWIVSLWLF